MTGGQVIHRARLRARLTQTELASRLGTSTSVISRWEHSKVEPSYKAVEDAVAACGLDLAAIYSEPEADPHDVSLLQTTLALSISERFERLLDYVAFVESTRLESAVPSR